MGLCSWIIFGFIAGLVARAIMPGKQALGIIATTLLGIGGSFVGGMLGAFMTGRDLRVLHPSGFIGAVIGSLVLLVLGEMMFRRR
jgi:uncharacterized membrane protein YeaQ/YmgE (transglycosylase-associated protein family)